MVSARVWPITVVPVPYKLPMLNVPVPELKVSAPEFPTVSKVPAVVENDAELNPADPPEATVRSTPLLNRVLTLNVPELTFTYPPKPVSVPFNVTKPALTFSVPPLDVSWRVPINVPELAFKVPSFVIKPLLNVLTETAAFVDTFRLPPFTDVREFPAPLKVRLPDPLSALTTDEPETVTVPADRVPTFRLPAKVETPSPASVSILTVAV